MTGREITASGTSKPLCSAVATGQVDADGEAAILAPTEFAPELGTAATVYLRSHSERVPDVQAVAAATANPGGPSTVAVSRPPDLCTARAEAKNALTGLVLALTADALLVGGVGIANTMVVSAMERRGEIGLRRAPGAARSPCSSSRPDRHGGGIRGGPAGPSAWHRPPRVHRRSRWPPTGSGRPAGRPFRDQGPLENRSRTHQGRSGVPPGPARTRPSSQAIGVGGSLPRS
nr:hypothetical protein KPHV_00940 [Kitasatospora purpeofusca]